jgi:hypothetical protein
LVDGGVHRRADSPFTRERCIMKLRNCVVAGVLVLLSACGESATAPTPSARPAQDGGGLMGSGTRIDPTPPPPAPGG